jgi:hypothetical protein
MPYYVTVISGFFLCRRPSRRDESFHSLATEEAGDLLFIARMSRSSTDAVQHSRLATDDSEMNPMSHAHVDSFDNEPLGDDLLDELESELGIARPADTTNRTPVRAQPPLSASKAIEPKAEQLRAAASQALGDQALVPMNVVSDQVSH